MTDDPSREATDHAPTSTDERSHSPGELHHPGDVADEAHGTADHGEEHGHDDHAHGGEALGPVDARAWGALILGAALGLVVAVCVAISTSA